MAKDWEDALWSGDAERARHLLESGVDMDSEDRPRQTGLRLLAEAGADRTIRGSGARTTRRSPRFCAPDFQPQFEAQHG